MQFDLRDLSKGRKKYLHTNVQLGAFMSRLPHGERGMGKRQPTHGKEANLILWMTLLMNKATYVWNINKLAWGKLIAHVSVDLLL